MQRFFGDSGERLLLSLLGDEEIDHRGATGRLKEAIARAADNTAPTHRGGTVMNGAPASVTGQVAR